MGDLVPGIDDGPHPDNIPDYFCHIEFLVMEAKMDNLITVMGWRQLTNKRIYLEQIKLLPCLKVERDSGISFSRVWNLINSPVITSCARDISYLLVNNKLPVRERLFHLGLINNPSCSVCPGSVVSDVTHFFCTCLRVCDVWMWMKQTINGLVGGLLSDKTIINYQFPRSNYDDEISWLLSSYIVKVWKEINYSDVNCLKKQAFFGYLRF